MLHGNATGIHRINAWDVADAAALAALSLAAADVGKMAYQTDINRYFILSDNVGPVWMMLPNHRTETLGNSTGTVDLDLVNGNTFTIYDQTGNIVFTFSNPVQDGYKASITLIISMDGAGGHTRTWPAEVIWAAGTEPTFSSGIDEVDMYTFVTVNGGTTWFGFLPGADMS